MGRWSQPCFTIPLAVAPNTILLIQLLTKMGQWQDVDDLVSHLPGNIGPTSAGDEPQVNLRHEQQGTD